MNNVYMLRLLFHYKIKITVALSNQKYQNENRFTTLKVTRELAEGLRHYDVTHI